MKRATSIIIGFYVVLTGVIACKKNTKSTDEQVLVVGYDSTNLNWRKDTFRITYSEETESNVYFEQLMVFLRLLLFLMIINV